MNTLIHITHEAHEKMGGIGAVLEGVLTTRAYQAAVGRTILVGTSALPLAKPSETIAEVLYQSGLPYAAPTGRPTVFADAFARIESTYGIRLLYARRRVPCPLQRRQASVELLLLDVRDALPEPANRLKGDLWRAFGLESDKFETDWGYEEWVRVAAPALDAVDALLDGDTDGAALVSHDFMGLPTVLAARVRMPGLKTIYWAHEVPCVRDLIEQESEHRLVFDQALETRSGLRSYQAILRDRGGYKHALVSRAYQAHRVFAVSERTAQELRLLSGEFERAPIEVVYNGLPARPITLAARLASRALLRGYGAALVGFEPDFVFTHVARPVASKAIERDLAVLEHLDDRLAERGWTAALLVLATDGGRRDPDIVRQMEAEYGWPLHHRSGWPDLVKGEVPIGEAAEAYNRWARATRVVLINQFGFSREACGDRAPEGLSFQDLRQGSDVEFGQSSYEPFGIAQLETLAFGGISLLTRTCGCAQLLARLAEGALPANILLANYASPPGSQPGPVSEVDTRRIEHEVAARLAEQLIARLPTREDAFQRLLKSGWDLAEKMSWQSVCRDYLVPALGRCFGRTRGGAAAPKAAAAPDPGVVHTV